MPGFIDRLMNMIRGKANAALDHLERPEDQLGVFVAELNDQVRDLQASVAAAIADEKRLKVQLDKQLDQAREWQRRAELALESDDESLAREALVKREDCEAQASSLRSSWEAQKEATEKLKSSLRGTKERIEEAKRRYTLLLAEYNSAKTREKIQTTLAESATSKSPMAIVGQLEEKIQAIEARTEAAAALDEMEADSVDLESRFLELEKASRGEEALAQLKATVGERKRLQSGSDGVSAAEGLDRVEELKRELDSE